MIMCPYCGATEKQYTKGLNIHGIPRYRCALCTRQYTQNTIPHPKSGTTPPTIIQCPNCGKDTTNPKFCSSSCAATYNNKLGIAPKRKKHCRRCGVIIHGRGRVCVNCNRFKKVDWTKRTLGDIQAEANYQINAVVRLVARQFYRQAKLPRECQNCGYSKHVEICHIQAIGTFPEDTPVSVVSGIENLVALCPNCHWEFDNGHLHYDDIAPR